MSALVGGTGRLMPHGLSEMNSQMLTLVNPASATTGDTVTITNPGDKRMLPVAVCSEAKSSNVYTNQQHVAWTHDVSSGVTTLTPAATIAAGDLIVVTYRALTV